MDNSFAKKTFRFNGTIIHKIKYYKRSWTTSIQLNKTDILLLFLFINDIILWKQFWKFDLWIANYEFTRNLSINNKVIKVIKVKKVKRLHCNIEMNCLYSLYDCLKLAQNKFPLAIYFRQHCNCKIHSVTKIKISQIIRKEEGNNENGKNRE